MTDAVMSDLVQRNAKFSCTGGVYWPVCSNSLDTYSFEKWFLLKARRSFLFKFTFFTEIGLFQLIF